MKPRITQTKLVVDFPWLRNGDRVPYLIGSTRLDNEVTELISHAISSET